MITKEQAQKALRKAKGNRSEAARALGITRNALRWALEQNCVDLAQQLRDTKDELEALRKHTSQKMPRVLRREKGSGLREGVALSMLSDLHVEELVRPDSTPVGNAFNLAIAEFRLHRYFNALLWATSFNRQAFAIRELVLMINGDLITGHLHDDNIEAAQLPPQAAALWVQQRIAAGLRLLLAQGGFERITCVCLVGNHGRTTKKMRTQTAAGHSHESWVYAGLAAQFAEEPRLVFRIPNSTHDYFQTYDFWHRVHHGHDVSYGGGMGGITIPINKAVAGWDCAKRVDYTWLGHFHQYIDTGRVAVNGSLIGFNAYALSLKASPEPPAQLFAIVDSKRGKSVRLPLWVSDPSKEGALWT